MKSPKSLLYPFGILPEELSSQTKLRRLYFSPLLPEHLDRRYEYRLPNGLHVASAAAGRAGKVLLAGGFLKESQWKSRPADMNRVATSFQLSFPS